MFEPVEQNRGEKFKFALHIGVYLSGLDRMKVLVDIYIYSYSQIFYYVLLFISQNDFKNDF